MRVQSYDYFLTFPNFFGKKSSNRLGRSFFCINFAASLENIFIYDRNR